MAQQHHQHHDPHSRGASGEPGAVGHGTADDQYLVTPPGAGYEHTDAAVWIIVKFGLWLAIAAIIIHVGLGFVFRVMVEQREEVQHTFPLAVGQEPRLPAQPRLQSIPGNDMYEFRLQEENVLQNYRWIDRQGGRVQIPIAEAMRLTVERGLPVRTPPDATTLPPAVPGMMPADSSAGRMVEGRRQ
jgi:hypothetical protein